MKRGTLGCTISIIGAGLFIVLFVLGTLTGFISWATLGILGGGGIILVICGLVIMSTDTKKPTNASQSRLVTPSSSNPPSPKPKQATSPVPLLNSQISGYKEERSVDVSQNNKERAIAYYNEGKRLHDQQRSREALRAFNEALKYDAFLLDAVEGKMLSHALLGEDEQALRTAERVFSLDQNSREAWRCIAGISWERKDYKRAWEGVNRLLSYDPKDSSALLIKAGLLEDEGRFSEALAVVNRALENDPNDEFLTEYRDALQQSIHKKRVEKTVDSIKFAGGIAGNVGKMIAQDVFLPNCLKCGAKLAPGEKICHVCGKPR